MGRRPARWTQKPCPSCGRIRNMPKRATNCGSCEGFGSAWGSHRNHAENRRSAGFTTRKKVTTDAA